MRFLRRNSKRLPGSLCDETPIDRIICRRCGGEVYLLSVPGEGLVWKHTGADVGHDPVLAAEWIEETTPEALTPEAVPAAPVWPELQPMDWPLRAEITLTPREAAAFDGELLRELLQEGYAAPVLQPPKLTMPSVVNLDPAPAPRHECGGECDACRLLRIELARERAELASARKSTELAGHIIAGLPTDVSELQFQLAEATRERDEEAAINAELRATIARHERRIQGLEITVRAFTSKTPTERSIEAARNAN